MSKPKLAPNFSRRRSRWRRRFFIVIGVWLLSTFLLSFHSIRGLVAYPLLVHDPDATGDAAYVMADGYAYWERLHAASDLFHMGKVPRLILLDESEPAGYNFVQQRLETRLQRAIAYLEWLGVPAEKVSTVSAKNSMFGSLSEARAVAEQESSLKSIVVVTSAPHTRRSRLCFQRAFSPQIDVQVYSASVASEGAEIDAPIWIEYAKLFVYFVGT
ncbi:YdcF family protein [Novipirellula artificiosorum]|uniref:DUF218 domain-containing protein n=1 Tax=Novipirellula artificiosorum TaxID=2528016 RepID=A0A5C6DU21_9BACT|nr:YdcF family protein [Novipirellula artificiosorum]TWU39724.1 hypothetical protein Poly41_25800 [Novipirellula artificiosorum]